MKSKWSQTDVKMNSKRTQTDLYIDSLSISLLHSPQSVLRHPTGHYVSRNMLLSSPSPPGKKKPQDLSISKFCFLSGFIQQWEFPVSGCSTARCSSLKVKNLTSTTPHLTNSNHPLYSKLAKARPAFPHWKSHKLPVAYSFSSSSELKTERGKSPSDHKRTEPIKAFAILETHHQVSDQAVSLDQEIEGFPQLHRDLTK